MMKCQQLIDFIVDYLEGSLDADVEEVFEKHIEMCHHCHAYLDNYREAIEMARRANKPVEAADEVVEEEVPEDLVEAILTARKQMD